MLKLTFVAVAAVCGLAACGPMSLQQSAAPTPAVRMSASTPALAGGYKKLAAPAGAVVYFVSLKDGDTVTSPLLVQFGLRGIGVAPAGVEKERLCSR